MKAVRLHGVGDMRVEEIAAPGDPGPGEVLVRVDAAGICGSDVHNFRTGMWISRLPTVPGHEFCGTVVAAGPGSALREGQRVVADSRVSCGGCARCRAGRPHLCAAIGYVGEVCDGGFAGMVRLPAGQVLALADVPVAAAAAAMAEPLAVAAHALNRLAPETGMPVAIAGAGAIGALAALLLRQRGHGPVYIADRNRERLALVTAATGAVAADLADLAGAIGEAPAFAIEATGSGAVADTLLAQLAPAARVASVGIFHGRASLDLNRIVEGEIDWLGCASFRTELAEVLPLLPALQQDMRAMASAPVPLDAVPDAYRALVDGTVATVKTIVVPQM
ncbi:MAG: alcohol dehydrogenase catalytic domain-containing protein [Alphaproteobacteria bacterium]